MIAQTSIEGLKQVIDIVDVLSNYLELKKVGSNFTACCPFHNEKTPSFVVNRVKGLYHCYGCGVGGDCIKFVMEHEKLSFIEAVEKIADLCNFELSYEKNSSFKKDDAKLLENIAKFYQRCLNESPPHQEYLFNRGVSKISIEKFGLGFCANSFESVRFVEETKLNRKELILLGVLGEDNARTYARFADRIIFPIHSPNGKVMGFGGRSIKENLAKYINSPQSKQFNKSKLLYGYHLAKENIYKHSQIIITEGYLDVIMLHQVGFNTAVATLGTALTFEHLPLLNKGDPKVILSYDGDKAGINAAFKASMLLAKSSKRGGVVIFANGLDPADMVAQKKTDELQALFDAPTPFIEFVFKQIALKFDLEDPLQKELAFKESSSFLHSLSPILQEEYKKFVSEVLRIPLNLIAPNYKKNIYSNNQFISLPQSKNDKLESLVIRYMLEDKSLLDKAIEYVDARAFANLAKEFDALCRGEFENPALIGIELDEGLLLREGGFDKELLTLIIRYKQRSLGKITQNTTLSFEKRAFLIRKTKDEILRLKKGEFITI